MISVVQANIFLPPPHLYVSIFIILLCISKQLFETVQNLEKEMKKIPSR